MNGNAALQLYAARSRLINNALVGTDVEAAVHLLVECVECLQRKAVDLFSGDDWMTSFLFQPLIELAQEHPERVSLFLAIHLLLRDVARLSDATCLPRQHAAQQCFQFIINSLSSLEQYPPSIDAFRALQESIIAIGGALKAADIDSIVELCFKAVRQQEWQVRSGALGTLTKMYATLSARRAPQGHGGEGKGCLLAYAADFIDLSLAIAKRHAQYDPSNEVREAACDLLSLLSSPPVASPSIASSSKEETITQEKSPVPVDTTSEPLSSLQLAHSPGNGCQSATKSSLVALATEPLPNFDSSDEGEGSVDGPLSLLSASKSSGPGLDLDTILSLESGLSEEEGSAVEIDVAEFLRGSIVPGTWPVLIKERIGLEREREQEGDVFDSLHHSGDQEVENCLTPGSNTCQETRNFSLPLRQQSPALPQFGGLTRREVAFLKEAMHSRFGPCGGESVLEEGDIEAILQHVLCLHSADAYEYYVAAAEIDLEREADTLQGHPRPASVLQFRAKSLEAKVHLAVTMDQARFLENAVPQMADVLANPDLARRCGTFSVVNA